MTSTHNKSKPVHLLYSDLVSQSKTMEKVSYWGSIPTNIQKLKLHLDKWNKENKSALGYSEDLVKILSDNLRSLGGLTDGVKNTLEKIRENSPIIESGHQPINFGGPGLIFNKAACINSISKISGLSPIFFCADYDQNQSELVNVRISGVGKEGLVIQLEKDPKYFNSPISEIPLPKNQWLDEILAKIEKNYHLLYSKIDSNGKVILNDRLDSVINLLRSTFYLSDSISEWSSRIFTNLVIIQGNLPIPIIHFSKIRHLTQDIFEFIAKEKIRKQLIEGFNNSRSRIIESGYEPGYGEREKEYSPFTYECQTKGCNKTRIIPKIHSENNGKISITGKCPKCNNSINTETSKENPDLSEFMKGIAPRVDTRQLIMNKILPIAVHIMGPGETSYYAQILETAIKSKPKFSFPILYRYTRFFYNTPWNEYLGNKLKEKNVEPLVDSKLFSLLKNIRISLKKGEEIPESFSKIAGYISESKESISNEINNQKNRLINSKNEKDRKKINSIQEDLNYLKQYYTNQFGVFAKEKNAQETSFLWLDLAIVTGLNDYLATYNRQYNELIPNSSISFINSTVPTCPKR
ncbi:MAG: bacillithiol biosynthesis protein BshC [Candidatus Ranarchaeia archaeon]